MTMNPYYYSNPYYNPQLPGGQPVYWYPAYPPAGYPPAVPARSPRHRRRELTPSPPPEILTHHILNSPSKLQWSVTNDPIEGHGQYFPTAQSNPTNIPNQILAEPATRPHVSTMQLLCDKWPIEVRAHGPVTVRDVLCAIWSKLQEPITHNEWNDLRSNARKNAHKARCIRVARGPARFAINEEASAIKKVDLLGDKVMFIGLKAVGPPEDPDDWVVRLGLPPR